MKTLILTLLSGIFMLFAGCVSTEQETALLPHWTFSPEMIFPADQSLNRCEDGVALADGRLIVTDQVSGLRLVELDGSSRPFGKFAEAGYQHNPPEIEGCANGVTLEPGGTHIIVADVFRGGIYRVEIATGTTERVYQHPFGVNMARADSLGGLWFTQSTRNLPEEGEHGLFKTVNVRKPDGAVYYVAPSTNGEPREAVQVVDGLYFANGLALDEAGGFLYVAECMGSKVLRFRMDVAAGQLSEKTVATEVNIPDNIELDAQGRLWIASPMLTGIFVYDPATGVTENVFRISSPESEALIEEANGRIANGTPWLDLMIPELWGPAPGLTTGMILSPDGGAVYVSGLGNALIRLDR
jgi:sugar lactone lactonase YvrE